MYIHKLKNTNGEQSEKGKIPFTKITIDNENLSNIVSVFESSYLCSQYVYDDIEENLEDLVEEVISIRNK